MSNNETKKSAADKVLDSIKTGRLKKTPGWHFLIKTALKIAAAIIVSLLLLHLAGFIHFTLHRTGMLYAPGFGFHGWLAFLGALPHILILLSIIFVIIFLIIIRHHRLVYRRPLLYSAIVVVLVAIIAGHLIAKSGFHAGLLGRARNIPVLGKLYRHYLMHSPDNMHRGVIVETNESGFVMKNERGEILTVVIGPETRVPNGIFFKKDDEVFVFGERNDDTVRALGLHEIER
jgi:hypothetical protein